MRTGSLLLDWYPFDKTFRLCARGYYNENKMDITVKSATSLRMGAKTHQPDELRKVTGEVGLLSLAPYVGIGLGNAVANEKKFSLLIDEAWSTKTRRSCSWSKKDSSLRARNKNL